MLEKDAKGTVEFMPSNKLPINPWKTDLMFNKEGKSVCGMDVTGGNDKVVSNPKKKLLGMTISANLG